VVLHTKSFLTNWQCPGANTFARGHLKRWFRLRPVAIAFARWTSFNLHMQAVKWRLHRCSGELIATGEEWKYVYLGVLNHTTYVHWSRCQSMYFLGCLWYGTLNIIGLQVRILLENEIVWAFGSVILLMRKPFDELIPYPGSSTKYLNINRFRISSESYQARGPKQRQLKRRRKKRNH
jgi:hypothetical protein